jgi:hypothetical protein
MAKKAGGANLDLINELNREQKQLNDIMNSSVSIAEKIMNQEKMIENSKRIQVEHARLLEEANKGNIELTKEEAKILDETLSKEKAINAELVKHQNYRKNIANVGGFIVDQAKSLWKILQDQDAEIKKTTLNLGMSGNRAKEMRLVFEQSIGAVNRLGGTIEDITKMQMGFAEETGKARVLSGEMLEDITAIGMSSGLGIENATKLAAQFEFMGVDVKNTLGFVQGVVETSERMGTNTTKVLKNVTDNFRKLGTFSFKNGVKAFGDMAVSAERTRVDMTTALNVAGAKRNLEDVIELAANLQVMGGNFAKMDPFQWLYMVRNEPEKLNDELSKMTEGMYTLKKNSKGVFERFISPADADRLRNVAKSLGIADEKMFEIAQKRLDLTNVGNQLNKLGLTGAQKELIEGAAILDEKTGKYQVSLAGHMVDISKLTKDQADAFKQEQKTLSDRAIEAQTFDVAFKNTINALKGALMPMLGIVNKALEKVRPLMDWISSWAGTSTGWIKAGASLLGAAIAWKGIMKAGSNWIESGNPLKGRSGGAGGIRGFMQSGNGAGSTAEGTGVKQLHGKDGRFVKGQNFKSGARSFGQSAGIGAAVGMAAVGVGAGIGLAAVGISKLADAMAKLTPEQAKTLNSIVTTLGIAVGVAAAATAAIIALGVGATITSPALLALGTSIIMIGGGIGIAAAGIGVMAGGMSMLVNSFKDVKGGDLMSMAGGIIAMAGGLALFANPISAVGLIAFTTVMGIMSLASLATARVADSMTNMGVALKGSAPDFIAIQNAIESISNAKTSGGGMIAELANLLKSPLKVEFAESSVKMVNDVTLNVDGEKLMRNTYDVNVAIRQHVEAKNGTGGHKFK